MQQIIRGLHNKRHRQLDRKRIKELTSRQLSNNIRYYSKQTELPHQILRHQYQHLENRSYNQLQRISEHGIYPLSYVFSYEPLKANIIEQEQKRSRNISEKNEFLRNFNSDKYQLKKKQYERKIQYSENLIKQRITKDIKAQGQISQMSVKLEKKNVKKYISTALKRLRVVGFAVHFCFIIRQILRKSIENKRKKCMNYGKVYFQQAMVSFQSYYFKILEQQITQYILLIQKSYRNPSINFNKNIFRMLTFMTSKLNSSLIPKPCLNLMELTCTNYSFYYFPFLFSSEIARLSFSEELRCTIDVGQEQSQMLVACLMGIQMLCYNMLYRPWLAEDLFRKHEKREFNIRQKYDKVKQIINNVGSVIYFLILDEFVLNLQIVQRGEEELKNILKQCRIQPIYFLQVIPRKEDEDNKKKLKLYEEQEQFISQQQFNDKKTQYLEDLDDRTNIIVGQNRKYYNRMKQEFASEMQIISQNITQWISKATLCCFKQKQEGKLEKMRKLYGQKTFDKLRNLSL